MVLIGWLIACANCEVEMPKWTAVSRSSGYPHRKPLESVGMIQNLIIIAHKFVIGDGV